MKLTARMDVPPESEPIGNSSLLARIAVLTTVFDGDPDAWLSCIRDCDPAPGVEEDVRFLHQVRLASDRDPHFLARSRELGRSLSLLCAELEQLC